MTNAQIFLGSLSHGTMRADDLLPVFTDELDRLNASEDCIITRTDNNGLIQECQEALDGDASDELKNELVDALFTALDNYSPAYAYFGSNEGDGSDYGFWFSQDTIEVAIKYRELKVVGSIEEMADPKIDYAVRGVGLMSGDGKLLFKLSPDTFSAIFDWMP